MQHAVATLVILASAVWPALAASSPTHVCTIDDPRVIEISGIVATAVGYVAINDSQLDPAAMRIFHIDHGCDVTATIGYPTPPRDPEDLSVAPDGALWVADTGDNIGGESRRETVALWKLVGSTPPVIYRLTYPDGPHDAEALLFAGNGVPVLVTKELGGTAGLYEPTDPLRPRTAEGIHLNRVGSFTPPTNGTTNAVEAVSQAVVTGAATSPDRRRVALRTYTVAYEWDVHDGDVVKAITTGVPRITRLTDEPQGEAIAYTPDGEAFLTVSDESGPTAIRRYPRGTETLPTSPSASPGTLPKAGPADGAAPAWLRSIPPGYGIAAAVVGLVLAAAGLVGLQRSRGRLRFSVASRFRVGPRPRPRSRQGRRARSVHRPQ